MLKLHGEHFWSWWHRDLSKPNQATWNKDTRSSRKTKGLLWGFFNVLPSPLKRIRFDDIETYPNQTKLQEIRIQDLLRKQKASFEVCLMYYPRHWKEVGHSFTSKSFYDNAHTSFKAKIEKINNIEQPRYNACSTCRRKVTPPSMEWNVLNAAPNMPTMNQGM